MSHFLQRISRSTQSKNLSLAVVFVALSCAMCFGAPQQNQPALQISSPANNAVVNPGQTLSVTVTSATNTSFASVGVTGDLGTSSVASSVPAQCSLVIPTKVALGKHTLTAVGTTPSNQVLYSGPIDVDVERTDMPTRLRADPTKVVFATSRGDTQPLRIRATFTDGTYLDATHSSNITFATSNSTIATVNQNGLVTSVAQGSATITATYTLGTQSITASVPVTIPAPLITNSPTALNFSNQTVGTTSSAQTVTVTNVSSNQTLAVGPVAVFGDFSESDNCISSSPLAAGGVCTISVTFAPTTSGSRTGAVTVMDGMDIVPQTVPLTGTGIGQPGTATTVMSSVNPAVYGQPVALTAAVTPSSGSGTPTGLVTFSDGSNNLGSAALASGQATFPTSSLAVGSHSITAAYGGDSNFLGSTSPTLSQFVNQASTGITLTSSANPATLNGSVTLTANLSVVAPGSGTPTGSITFQDGSNTIATVPVSAGGQATFSTATLVVGPHSLTASYGGDTNFKSSSGSLTQQIAYGICVLYDQTRSVNSGAVFPIKLYLCNVNGSDVSSSNIVLHATGISNVSGFSGPVQSPGNANPDYDFRFDSTLGPAGGYIFNLDTSGLATGTYSLQFTAGADPLLHTVNFGVK